MRTPLHNTAPRHTDRRDPWRLGPGAEGHRQPPPWILIPRRRQPVAANESVDLEKVSAAEHRAFADV